MVIPILLLVVAVGGCGDLGLLVVVDDGGDPGARCLGWTWP
jgi:hypothetical protein